MSEARSSRGKIPHPVVGLEGDAERAREQDAAIPEPVLSFRAARTASK
ncbi:MAG: hypothetical protein LVQ64_04915 [Thermoplasmatales archaeon]|nr:hypothetical protein [Thermoplasmatales archaeon]